MDQTRSDKPLKSVFLLFAKGHGQCLSGTHFIFCKTAFANREAAEAEKEAFFRRCTTMDDKHIDSLDPEQSKAIIQEFPVVGEAPKDASATR